MTCPLYLKYIAREGLWITPSSLKYVDCATRIYLEYTAGLLNARNHCKWLCQYIQDCFHWVLGYRPWHTCIRVKVVLWKGNALLYVKLGIQCRSIFNLFNYVLFKVFYISYLYMYNAFFKLAFYAAHRHVFKFFLRGQTTPTAFLIISTSSIQN